MTLHHFLTDGGRYIGDVKIAMLSCNFGVKNNLQKNVAKLIIHVLDIVFTHRLDVFVAFFQKIG